ncbi:MAG: glutathione S-transferase N-terminal domain-containing protein [Polyangiaceae bacterium]|nr:glutathione S-transferase N-terminal domain-containing protein [Polyangiaceae bacterium]
MKLYGSTTSPFVRKVSVLAREVGLWERIEEVTVKTSPLAPSEPLAAAHPLAKLPTLTLDDGEILYDSRVICEHLDSLHAGRPMFPRDPAARRRALRQQALADGVLDAAILVFYETVYREPSLRDPRWQAAQARKAQAGLDALEREAETLVRDLDIGGVAVACALAWLEFRAPVGDVRAGRPRLTAWYEQVAARPSMVETRPRV